MISFRVGKDRNGPSVSGKKLEPHSREHPYFWYTLLYLLCLLGLLWLMRGKSFVRRADANLQHYQVVVYLGQWLRDGIRGLFSGEKAFQTWSLQLGLGGDVIKTLHFYGLGDPLMLLSVFFSGESTELFYDIEVLLRLYLAGLACVYFFRCRKLCASGAVAGALVYVFSGYGMNPGIFHPFFAIPLVCLPLLLTGIERIYQRNNYRLFVLSVFLSAVSNLYFFYMLAIFTALYAILRYFFCFPRSRPLAFFTSLIKITGSALLGCGLAAPILLPNIAAILSSDRMSAARDMLSLYPSAYYRQMPAALVSNYVSYYYYAAVSSVAVLLTILLLSTSVKRYLEEKIILASLFLITLFPMAGALLNGGTYATNRWIWALILALAWCTARIMTDFSSLRKSQLLISLGGAAAYSALCLLPRSVGGLKILLPVLILWLGVLLLLLCRTTARTKILRNGMVFLVILGISANNWLLFSPEGEGVSAAYVDANTVYSEHRPDYLRKISALPGSQSSRFDQFLISYHTNDAMMNGLNGTSYYFSSIDGGTSSFQRSQWLSNGVGQRYHGLDLRSYLMLALGVRYLAVPKNNAEQRCYGYDTLVAETETEYVYSSEIVPDLVYVFDQVLRETELSDVLQRQQALLQAAVIPDDMQTELPPAELNDFHSLLPFTVSEASRDIEFSDGTIIAKSNQAVLELQFDPVASGELYLLVEGIRYDRQSENDTAVEITVSDGKANRALSILTPLDNFYCGYSDFLINLGYAEAERGFLRLQFHHQGSYHFQSLSVAVQPMKELEAAARRLQNSGVSDIQINQDTIQFQTARTEAGIACIAVPYSSGWQTTVDGRKAALQQINGGLCGIELPSGCHQVILRYRTPLLSTACYLLIASILIISFRGILLTVRKKRSH